MPSARRRLIVPFVAALFFGGWNVAMSILTVAGVLLPVAVSEYFQQSATVVQRIIYIAVVFTLVFFAKVLRQYWLSFSSGESPIRVASGVTGEDASGYHFAIRLSSFINAHEGQLLTLYSGGSGVPQPVGLLKVVDTTNDDLVVAVPLGDPSSIRKYFDEDSRRRALFARIQVRESSLAQFILIEEQVRG